MVAYGQILDRCVAGMVAAEAEAAAEVDADAVVEALVHPPSEGVGSQRTRLLAAASSQRAFLRRPRSVLGALIAARCAAAAAAEAAAAEAKVEAKVEAKAEVEVEARRQVARCSFAGLNLS